MSVGTELYRGANKGSYVLLSRTQAGPGRTVKQEQEEISHNHVQTFICLSVQEMRSGTGRDMKALSWFSISKPRRMVLGCKSKPSTRVDNLMIGMALFLGCNNHIL